MSALADFKVIEIVDDNNPYTVLLGIDWATVMNGVINLKKCKMIFEKKSLCVVVPLDPAEGSRYIQPVCNDESDNESNDDIDYIYKITPQEKDWVNPIADGNILWKRESSCTSYLDEEIERWRSRNLMVRVLSCGNSRWRICWRIKINGSR